MWHTGHDHTEDEIKVLRELEYDLFMFDPGFRAIWDNNFESYFQSLFDEQMWEHKMEESMSRASAGVNRQMLEDPEFAALMREQAIVDSVLSGELKPENAPVEMRQDLEQMLEEAADGQDDDDTDELCIMAKNWATDLSRQVGPLYEQFGNIQLFRILTNCYIVAGKIFYANQGPDLEMPGLGAQWQPDRVGYTLALTSLRRCLESLTKLGRHRKLAKLLDRKKFSETGKKIQTQLIDRLDEIEQQRLHA